MLIYNKKYLIHFFFYLFNYLLTSSYSVIG